MTCETGRIAGIVVCEDDDATLDLLCDHLTADRFDVLPAPSAADALRLCRYNHPDLMLLDLGLPDVSGLEVLTMIREAEPFSRALIWVRWMPARTAVVSWLARPYPKRATTSRSPKASVSSPTLLPSPSDGRSAPPP